MNNTNYLTPRHIGISAGDAKEMLNAIGVKSTEELIEKVIPANIRLKHPLPLPAPLNEKEYIELISSIADKNKVFRTYIGKGWYDTYTPAVIQRNVLENPVWYTSYTPYQAEISQGRLEALMNYQTVICELTSLPLANCSLLDEATAGAEAVTMMYNIRTREQIRDGVNKIFIDRNIFEQTKAVIHTRMIPQGIDIVTGDWDNFIPDNTFFGAIVQYPDSKGEINDYTK